MTAIFTLVVIFAASLAVMLFFGPFYGLAAAVVVAYLAGRS